jgi:hypothetical protein
LANSSHADLRLKSACYSYLEISKRLYGALTFQPTIEWYFAEDKFCEFLVAPS